MGLYSKGLIFGGAYIQDFTVYFKHGFYRTVNDLLEYKYLYFPNKLPNFKEGANLEEGL